MLGPLRLRCFSPYFDIIVYRHIHTEKVYGLRAVRVTAFDLCINCMGLPAHVFKTASAWGHSLVQTFAKIIKFWHILHALCSVIVDSSINSRCRRRQKQPWPAELVRMRTVSLSPPYYIKWVHKDSLSWLCELHYTLLSSCLLLNADPVVLLNDFCLIHFFTGYKVLPTR